MRLTLMYWIECDILLNIRIYIYTQSSRFMASERPLSFYRTYPFHIPEFSSEKSWAKLTSRFRKKTLKSTRYLTRLIEWSNLSKLSAITELRMTIEPQCRRVDSTDIVAEINHRYSSKQLHTGFACFCSNWTSKIDTILSPRSLGTVRCDHDRRTRDARRIEWYPRRYNLCHRGLSYVFQIHLAQN